MATLSSLLMRFGKTSMRLGQPLVVLELLHAVRRFHSYTHMLHNICPLGRCVRMWACASVLCTQVDGYVNMSSRMHARRICPYSCLCLCACAYFSIVPLCLSDALNLEFFFSNIFCCFVCTGMPRQGWRPRQTRC